MSLSFSPSSEYLLVGVRSDKVFGCFLKISKKLASNRTECSTPTWIYTERDEKEKEEEEEEEEHYLLGTTNFD